jgi:hypothetical protein
LHGIGTQAAPVFADICGSKIVDEIKSVGGWNKQKGHLTPRMYTSLDSDFVEIEMGQVITHKPST